MHSYIVMAYSRPVKVAGRAWPAAMANSIPIGMRQRPWGRPADRFGNRLQSFEMTQSDRRWAGRKDDLLPQVAVPSLSGGRVNSIFAATGALG